MEKDNRIIPDDFWSFFRNIIKEYYKTERRKFEKCYSSNSTWTKYLTNLLEKEVPKKFSLHSVMKEYWLRVDIAFFDKCADDWAKWSWEIAVELENNAHTWWQECNKLMAVNSGLKVLITYYDTNLIELKDQMVKFASIYNSRKYHTRDDQWLIVFGPMDPFSQSGDKKFYAFKLDVENEKAKFKSFEYVELF